MDSKNLNMNFESEIKMVLISNFISFESPSFKWARHCQTRPWSPLDPNWGDNRKAFESTFKTENEP